MISFTTSLIAHHIEWLPKQNNSAILPLVSMSWDTREENTCGAPATWPRVTASHDKAINIHLCKMKSTVTLTLLPLLVSISLTTFLPACKIFFIHSIYLWSGIFCVPWCVLVIFSCCSQYKIIMEYNVLFFFLLTHAVLQHEDVFLQHTTCKTIIPNILPCFLPNRIRADMQSLRFFPYPRFCYIFNLTWL